MQDNLVCKNKINCNEEKICLFERSKEKSFFESWNIFSQKNYNTIIRTYWATKYESRCEIEFWLTCQNISNLFDGCWYPLLRESFTLVALMSIITNMSLLRNDNFELKTADIKLVTSQCRHPCRYWLVRAKQDPSFPKIRKVQVTSGV